MIIFALNIKPDIHGGSKKSPDTCFSSHCRSVLIFIKRSLKCFVVNNMNVNEILLLMTSNRRDKIIFIKSVKFRYF